MASTTTYLISIYSALLIMVLLSRTASAACNPPSPPCQNGGNCQDNMCQCPSTYIGMKCEIIVQASCTPDPCKNGAPCTVDADIPKGYHCNCVGTGFSGALCEISISGTCTQNADCNGGTCNSNSMCECVGDTWGASCENEKAVLRFDNPAYHFREGQGMIEVQVRRNNGQNFDLPTDFYVTDNLTGSATPDVDYSFTPVQMRETFSPGPGPGSDMRKIKLQILNEDLIEDAETIELVITVVDQTQSRIDTNADSCTITIDPSDQPDSASPCSDPTICFNSGTCTVPNPGSFVCQCLAEYEGRQCENTVPVGCNKVGSECQNGGTCTPDDGLCQCAVGYRGAMCEEKKPYIKFQDIAYSVLEGDMAQVYVHRSENLNIQTEITVTATPLGQTVEGVDYTFSPNPMSFTMAVGAETQLIAFPILGDDVTDSLESIQLELTGQGRIQNNANVAVVTITEPSTTGCNTATTTCQNNGVCQSDGTCMCTANWAGTTCTMPHACTDVMTCEHGGTCVRVSGNPSYSCQCTEDFRGKHCELPADGGGNNNGQGGGGGGGLSTAASISIAAIVGFIILVIAIVIIVMYCRRSGKSTGGHSSRDNDATDNVYFRNQTRGKRRQATVYDKADRKIGAEFPREKLKLHEHIGSGAFANVVRANAMGIVRRGNNTVVAVKMLKESATDSDRSDFVKELKVYRMLEPHPNIIVMLGCCASRDPMYLIMEYAPHGNLQSHIRGIRNGPTNESPYINTDGESAEAHRKYLTPTEILTFAFQTASGMKYLASKQCIHRDLATRNVLLGDGLVCKLSDFGLARDITEQNSYEMQSRGRVPVRWMAPESLLENSYTSKSDVWSFAVLMWELVTVGSHPYPGMSSKKVIEELQKGYRLPKPEYCSDEIYALMMECWQERPEKRPSFTDVHAKIETMLEDAQGYLVMTEFKSDAYVYLEPDQQGSDNSEFENDEHNGGASGSV